MLNSSKLLNISAAVLAGGEGRRMGSRDKSCLEISGQKLISLIIAKLEGLFNETFIITRTPENHRDLSIRLEGDVFEARSSLTGVHAALYHSRTDHVFVTACDSPFLNRELIKDFLTHFTPEVDVLIPVHPNGMYEPLCAVYSKKCLPFIEENLQKNIYQIIRFFPQVKIRTVETARLKHKDRNLETFINVNTPEELDNACKRANNAE
ncbi:molybdenum cofactor guanylyltransferase [Maridesulfovibrio zosterae]|uniref:molybdenum cofactor guanylyltransferase n=1 Tax=Maridesulfovibrio zosterae TaxID=82171 RepID=UPI00041F5DF8|nr:molybdenum cofactor guanylyltransferase [Maridesulfovibrio zosterae]